MAVACLQMLKTISVRIFHVRLFAFAGIAQRLKKTNDSIEKIKQMLTFLPNFYVSLVTFLGVAHKIVLVFVVASTMQACSFVEKWHKGTTMEKNLCGSQVDFSLEEFSFGFVWR